MNTTLPMSLKPMEPHRLNGGTFYSKRRNLVKLAASVLSLEEREVNIKGLVFYLINLAAIDVLNNEKVHKI